MPRQSLRHKYPDYRVDLEPHPGRVRVGFGDQVVADSRRALMVRETKHDPVIYFPRDDVRLDLLERSAHRSFCPFKGTASYWTLHCGDRVESDAVWSYEEPLEEVAGLAGYLAFYGDKVDWIREGPA